MKGLDQEAVRASGHQPQRILLRAQGLGVQTNADAAHRRAVHGEPGGQSALAAALAPTRIRRQGGPQGCLRAVPVRPSTKSSHTSAQHRHKPRESGLEHRHHLHQAEERIRLFDGGHRLVQQMDTELAAFNDIEL